ncbi:MAG TPA: hypothetical protein VN325_15160 [Steroidobacteraceae bacterium]|nr:hypothetical protein [Steroidobacteraceae bacterium]
MTVRIRNHDAGRFLAILCDDAGRKHPIVIRAIVAHHRIDIGRDLSRIGPYPISVVSHNLSAATTSGGSIVDGGGGSEPLRL